MNAAAGSDLALARQIQEELRAELDLRRTDVTRLADAPLRELAARVVRRNVARRELPPGRPIPKS